MSLLGGALMAVFAFSIRRFLRVGFVMGLALVLIFALLPHPPVLPYLDSDSLQHGAAFAGLTIAARMAWPDLHWASIYVSLAGFGLTLEILQSMAPTGRTAELADWAADCAAIAVVLLLSEIWRHVQRKASHSVP